METWLRPVVCSSFCPGDKQTTPALSFREPYSIVSMMIKDELINADHRISVRALKKNAVFRFPQMLDRYVFFLRDGFLKVAVANMEGKEVIKYLVKPGSLFGKMPLLNGVEEPGDYAVALEDSVIWLIETEKLKQFMENDPELHRQVSLQISRRIKSAEDRFLSMIYKDAFTRICDFLTLFAKEFGKQTEGGYEFRNLLTHDDISKLTATSRQTVSSVLNTLREQKQIEYNNEIVRIPSSSYLCR